MNARHTLVVLVLVALLSLVIPAFAQDGAVLDSCFNLSAEDCELVNTAAANSTAATSWIQSYTFDFTMSGLGELTGQGDISVSSAGSGPFVPGGSGQIPTTMSMDLTGSVNGGSEEQAGSLAFIIVDDFLYCRGVPGMEDMGDTWSAVNLAAELESGELQQILPIPLPESGNPADMLSGLTEQLGPFADPAFLDTFGALFSVPGAIDYVRMPEADGLIPFNFTLDINALISSPEFTQILTQIGETAEDPTVVQLGAFLPLILQDAVVNITQYVDPASNFLAGFDLSMGGTVNAGMLSGDTDVPPITTNLDFSVQLSDFNTEFNIAAPESFEENDDCIPGAS